jgi:hypothetical protein
MKYKRDQFSEDEINSINALGNIVAHVFKIDVSELRSHVRKRRFTDARKVLSSVSSSNIHVGLCERFISTNFHCLALTAWYLDVDHSSVSYAIDKSTELYDNDKEFKMLYDSVIALINEPSEELLNRIDTTEHEMDRFTWNDVKDNMSFTHKLRYSLAPEEVILDIANLYVRGYSNAVIYNKYQIVPSFISYVAKMRKVNKISRKESFMTANQLIARRNVTLAPLVRSENKINY